MKIYDCFTFFNELDLLEIRLEELYNFVDYFVLVEANQTHGGDKKPLYYNKNKERYKKYQDKIIHIVVDLPKLNFIDNIFINQSKKGRRIFSEIAMSYSFGKRKTEDFQRMSIKEGLTNCADEDIIIISDLDEIWRNKKIKEAIELANKGHIVGFEQKMFIYYINGSMGTLPISTKLCSYKTLQKKCRGNPSYIRIPYFLKRVKNKLSKDRFKGNNWHTGNKIIKDGGWQFSFLGGAEKIKLKRKNSSHSNVSTNKLMDLNEIEKDIKKGNYMGRKVNYIKIDKTFPETIQKNKKKYAHLIKKLK